MPFEVQDEGGRSRLRLHGRWTVAEAAADGPRLREAARAARGAVVVDAAGVEALDLTGAWFLRSLERQLRDAGRAVEWAGPRPAQLEFIDRLEAERDKTPPAAAGIARRPLRHPRSSRPRRRTGEGRRARPARLRRRGHGRLWPHLREPAAPAVPVDRAARLRDGPHGRADRFADRLPDRRHRRLHRCPAAAQVRRRDLRRGSRDGLRAARARRAADGDHRGRPLGQRFRRGDRRHEAERGGRCAACDRHGPHRGAGAAAHPRARHRAACTDHARGRDGARSAVRSCPGTSWTSRSASTSSACRARSAR